MESQKLSGAEKAAILLLCLGEEATSKVFEALSDAEVREITRHMINIEHIPAEVSRDVVAEFHRTQKTHAGIFVRGNEFVKKVISGVDQTRVERLMEDITWEDEARPLETIAIMQPHMVASLLENEHPQTVALILSTQKIDHSAKILNCMNESVRSDVMYRIARISRVSPEIVGQIEDALRKEIGIVARQDKQQQQLGGVNRVVDIINNMGQGADKKILEGIGKTDPDMAEEIRKNMFRFEDLINLDGRTLQTILREVNNDQLTLALKSASDNLKESIFQNISGRAAEMIQDDLEAMGPVKLSEVETMQQTIVKIVLKLEEEEKILIPGRGGADALV